MGSPGGGDPELLAVGRIARAHGIRGEVAIRPLTEVEGRFAPGVVLRGEDDRRFTIRAARPFRDGFLVFFEEVADRGQAEALRGTLLLVPADEAPELPEGSWWEHQVVGLAAVTDTGRSLGTIAKVLHNPANDVWETDTGVLIPVVRDFVIEVDPEAGRAVIRDVPGLEG